MRVVLVKTATKHPAIGLGYLAGTLEREKIPVWIIDYFIQRMTPGDFKRQILELQPDVVGISTFSFNIQPSFEMARFVKEVLPNCHVTMGGAHPTGLPEHTLRNPHVDTCIMNEGEETLLELVQKLEKGESYHEVRGIAYRGPDGKAVVNPERLFIQDVDSIPFPSYHLMPVDKYFEFPDPHGIALKHPRFMPIFTSRGCPFHCTYCHNIFGKSFRARSPENVLQEMELLYHQYGIREFHIEDDIFNIDKTRAKKVMDMIVERGLKISIQFPNGIRAEGFDDELARKMKRAGTFVTAFGVETASPRVMKEIKKNLNLDKVRTASRLAVKHGILSWGFFMLGFTDESREEMEQTIRFACEQPFHLASFSILMPFPCSEIFDNMKNQIDADTYFDGTLTFSSPRIQMSQLTIPELVKVKKYALKKFYNWKRLLRIALTIRIHSWYEFKFYWGKIKKNLLFPKFGEYLRNQKVKLQTRMFSDGQLRRDTPSTTAGGEVLREEPPIEEAVLAGATARNIGGALKEKPHDQQNRRWFVNRWF